jgi:hypothetical protein
MSDLRSALESAFADPQPEQEAAPIEQAPEPAVSEPEVKADRARDDAGRFAKKEEAPEVSPEITPEPPPAPVRKAPSSWKPAAQEAFLKADRGEALTPEEIRLLTQEAERRENDFHKGVSEFKTHSERAKAYDQVIAPYQAHLQKLGVDAPTAISALMRADYTLRNGDPATKAQYFQQLAREYGIDLNQPVPQVDPNTQYLMQQLNELQYQQQVWQNQIQQQEQAKAMELIQSMASDTANYPHFEAVRPDMADLLESGKAKSEKEAYDMAVWMRPDIRQSLIDQQRAEAQRKAIETAQAQKAKAAAVSVKGSSPSAVGVQPVKGSLRDMLAAQFDAS